MKKLLLVGNCNNDGPKLKALFESMLEIHVDDIKTIEEAKEIIEQEEVIYDLIAVNRVGAFDGRSGLELIDYINKNDIDILIMMITNFPDKMDESVVHGAVRGFGKDDALSSNPEKTLEIVGEYMED